MGHAAVVRQAGRAYGASPIAVSRRIHRLTRDGYRLDEARVIGLLDPSLAEQALSKFLPARRLHDLQLRLDPVPLTRVMHDKALFYFACGLAELPVPTLCGCLYRHSPGWTSQGRTPATRAEWAEALAAALPGEFVVKPAQSDFGEGIRFFRRAGAGFHEGARVFGDAGALYDSLLEDPAHEGFVLQERLRNHPLLTRLSGSETLQTLRLHTLVDATKEVVLVNAAWKVVIGDALIDNFHDGANGNGIIRVSTETGRCTGPLVLAGPGGMGYLPVDRHPQTGIAIDGVQLPHWEQTVKLVRRAARTFAMLRTIGWDIAVTPAGPVIVEGNSFYSAPNEVGDADGLRRRLEETIRSEEFPSRDDTPPAYSAWL